MIKGSGRAYRRAKELRRDMSLPETLLWRQLRKKQTGFHWRKQHPAGEYDLDFYCDRAKLCVEVDGEAHERGERSRKDARRDRWIEAQGIRTLRIPAQEILSNLDGVLIAIGAIARKRAPLHRPSDGPPPPDKLGEDF
jgi:very-short-patch-repair endonuclease